MIDDCKFYSICDRAHLLLATLLVVVPFMFLGWKAAAVGSAIIIVWATWKECWYDERHEAPVERGDGMRDFIGYFLGTVLGVAICAVKMYLVSK